MPRWSWLSLPVLLAPVCFPASANDIRHRPAYGDLPLSFEANGGQTNARVKFLARGNGYALFVTGEGFVLSLANGGSRAAVRVRMLGTKGRTVVDGLDQLPGKSNYFRSSDRGLWRTGIPNYGKVRYRGVYPGIDLVLYGNQRQLEYDFTIAPGADPEGIQLAVDGVESLELDAAGDLVARTPAGEIRQRMPSIFQEAGGKEQPVSGRFVLERNRVAFKVGRYDRARPLRIDPVLSYASFLGGSAATGGNDTGTGIAVDGAGNVYIAGSTESAQFPTTTSSLQMTYAGGALDGFVMKLDPTGSQVLYATYLGTASQDDVAAIAVDAAGNAYVTGYTGSSKFPVTAGAAQAVSGGSWEGFALKLDPTGGHLVYSTFIGGNNSDNGTAIAVDATGAAYVAGTTYSSNFPVTSGAYHSATRGDADAFVVKINPQGTGFVYSALAGGSGRDTVTAIAVDSVGQAYVAGATFSQDYPLTPGVVRTTAAWSDGFVTKLSADGARLVYSTLIGGTNADEIRGIAADSAGNAYIVGQTSSRDLPVTAASPGVSYGGGPLDPVRFLFGVWINLRRQHLNGGTDGFFIKLNDTGTAILHCSYLGGKGQSAANAVALDPASGDVFIAGETAAPDFAVTPGAAQPRFGGGTFDGFIMKLSGADFGILYSSYLGGGGEDRILALALDSAGGPYLTGKTASGNFPVSAGPFQRALAPGGFYAFAAALYPGGGLRFCTYAGGSGSSSVEEARDVAVDGSGNAYVTGTTISPDLPVTPGALVPVWGGSTDAFVMKVDPTGHTLLYSTYLGGGGDDTGNGIAVDGAGNAYVTGFTGSGDFPLTGGSYRTRLRSWDGYVTKINPDGSDVVYSTVLGGGSNDGGMRIAVDSAGNACVAGYTKSTDFPATAGSAQTTFGGNDRDAFVAKLSPDGKNLLFATFLGGTGVEDVGGIALDSGGAVYVSGTTTSADFPVAGGAFQTSGAAGMSKGFVAKLDGGAGALIYSALLAGNQQLMVTGVAVDAAGDAYFTGYTNSRDFPTTSGVYKATCQGSCSFAAKLNPQGSALVYSTFLFESGSSVGAYSVPDGGYAVAVDAAGNAYVGGATSSGALPATDDAPQVNLSGTTDGFLAKVDAAGKSVPFLTYVGGARDEKIEAVRVDAQGNVYVVGFTSSAGFPATAGAFQPNLAGPRSGFVAKVDFSQTSPVERPKIANVVNYSSGGPDFAPGVIITITGDRLATSSESTSDPLTLRTDPLPSALDAARVSIPTRNIPLFSVSPQKIVAQLPFGVAISQQTAINVVVNGVSSTPYVLNVVPAAIGILGTYKPDLSPISSTNRVMAGDAFVAYLTGFGRVTGISSGFPTPGDQTYTPTEKIFAWSAPAGTANAGPLNIESYSLVPGLVGVAQAVIRTQKGSCPDDTQQWDFWIATSTTSNKVRVFCLMSPD